MSKSSIIESLLAGYIEGRLSPNESVFRNLLMKNIDSSSVANIGTEKEKDFSKIYGRIIQEIDRRDSEEAELRAIRRKSTYRRLLINITSAAAVFAIAFISGRLSTRNEAAKTEDSFSTYEVKAPYGSRSEIGLPDGTTVILNAGSFLSYRNDYNNSNRNVTLNGEAYFKVARNEYVPFIVNAGPLSITALGTEFNVKAYDDEIAIETTLVSGKVEISREGPDNDSQVVDLNPNQKAIFIRNEEGFLLENVTDTEESKIEPVKTIMSDILIAPKVNVDQVVAWTEGKLILRGENLDRLCVELERKYDVSVVFREEEIKKFRFTGVLLDETLEQVLNVIKLTAPISYSLEGKTVYLSSDPHSLDDFSKYIK